jgi:hypothetical protein
LNADTAREMPGTQAQNAIRVAPAEQDFVVLATAVVVALVLEELDEPPEDPPHAARAITAATAPRVVTTALVTRRCLVSARY